VQPRPFKHKCVITVPETSIRKATLTIDGKPFNQLPFCRTIQEGQNLTVQSAVLQHQYGLTIPTKIVETEHLHPRDVLPAAAEKMQDIGAVDAAKYAASGAQAQAKNIAEQIHDIDVKAVAEGAQGTLSDLHARAQAFFNHVHATCAPRMRWSNSFEGGGSGGAHLGGTIAPLFCRRFAPRA